MFWSVSEFDEMFQRVPAAFETTVKDGEQSCDIKSCIADSCLKEFLRGILYDHPKSSWNVYLPVLFPFRRNHDERGKVPENSTSTLNHSLRVCIPHHPYQEGKAFLILTQLCLVLLAVSRQVPQSWQNHLQRPFICLNKKVWLICQDFAKIKVYIS